MRPGLERQFGEQRFGWNPESVLLRKHGEGPLKAKWGNGCGLHQLFSTYSDWRLHLNLQFIGLLQSPPQFLVKKHIFPSPQRAFSASPCLASSWWSSEAAKGAAGGKREWCGDKGAWRVTWCGGVCGWLSPYCQSFTWK